HIPQRLWWRERRQVLVWAGEHGIAAQNREFDDALARAVWTARETERGSDRLLPFRNRKVVANLIFAVLVPLLRALDIVVREARGTEVSQSGRNLLKRAAESAHRRLDDVEQYVESAELQAAVRYYLFGLPLGFALVLAVVLSFMDSNGGIDADPNRMLLVAATGGLGSIASVMIRLTRGQNLSVNPRQGPIVTVISGAFRTMIGTVFGVALYVLVQGDLLPLDDTADGSRPMFYAGLAFLAGFSERWAQDTIVRSAPISPSPITATDGIDGTANRGRAWSQPGRPVVDLPAARQPGDHPGNGNGAAGEADR
ncbi:MAG TPA: hypothetical protein VNP92_27530, partial [Actinophytocola sp.]|nr:hypothetical protein [Actinophytocola sp.]